MNCATNQTQSLLTQGGDHPVMAQFRPAVRCPVMPDIAKAPVSLVEQVSSCIEAGLSVRVAHRQVDGLAINFHDLRNTDTAAYEHAPSCGRVLKPSDHHCLGTPGQQGGDQLGLQSQIVVAHADHSLKTSAGQRRLYPFQHFWKNDIGQRRHEDPDQL